MATNQGPCFVPIVWLFLLAMNGLPSCGMETVDDCPLLCTCTCANSTSPYCDGLDVMCNGSTQLPGTLPQRTKSLLFTNSTFDFIPINAYLNLNKLKILTFNNVAISTVRACSIAELENLDAITFQNCNITTIEGNAFSNLFNISLIRFLGTTVSEVRSFAFHNLTSIRELQMTGSTFGLINRFAFLKLQNVQSLVFKNCQISKLLKSGFSKVTNVINASIAGVTFDTIQCETLEELAANTDSLTLKDLKFKCDCNLAWMWKHFGQTTNHSGPFNESLGNQCDGLGNIASIAVEQICPKEESRDEGCPSLLPTPPHSCSRVYDDPLNPVTKVTYPTYFSSRAVPNTGSRAKPEVQTFVFPVIIAAILQCAIS